jgi:sec-independent protein translocase protein TatA
MHIVALVTPGPTEWVLILVIVLVLFGAKKLPELARSLGQSMNEFRKAREEFDKELRQAGQDLKGNVQGTQPYQAQQPAQTPAQPAPTQTAQPQPPPQQPTQPS